MSQVLLRRQGNIVAAMPQSGITVAGLHKLMRNSFKYGLKVRNDRRRANYTGQKYTTEPRYLCSLQTNAQQPAVLFPAGLLHKASVLFAQCKIQWSLEDLRPRILPDPDIHNMELHKMSERDDQLRCLATIFNSDMGVIESPTGIGKTFVICQLCRAYPKSNIIISSYRADVIGSIFDRLRTERHVPLRELGQVGGGKRSPKRVTVSTIDSIEHCDIDGCRLFLYDECHEAASEERQAKIARIRMARMFGFSASPRGRSDGADLAIEAMFGPVIYELPYQEGEAKGRLATITVKVRRVPGSPIPYDDEVQQYRHGIWRNDYRNHLIAQDAVEYAMKDHQVLIMVDKVEHALMIKSRYLPRWPIVHGSVATEKVRAFKSLGILQDTSWLCTKDQREQYRKDFENGRIKFIIATGVWSQGVDMKHLDVLVRGDAQTSIIKGTQVPGRLSRGEAGLLRDYDDVFDERFASRSNKRFRHYESKGWDVIHC